MPAKTALNLLGFEASLGLVRVGVSWFRHVTSTMEPEPDWVTTHSGVLAILAAGNVPQHLLA